MGIVVTNNQNYTDIANAIRSKNGSSDTYLPSEMAEAINGLNVSGVINLQNKNVTPTESQQVITKDSGYDGLDTVTVAAISNTYVGSGISQYSKSEDIEIGNDLSYWVAPGPGYWDDEWGGSIYTPIATKGTVSGNSVSVTPSVGVVIANQSGTRTGTAVTVSASELVSGSQTITENGTVDVTNLESVIVDVSTNNEVYPMIEYINNQFIQDTYIIGPSFSEISQAYYDGLLEPPTAQGNGSFTVDGYFLEEDPTYGDCYMVFIEERSQGGVTERVYVYNNSNDFIQINSQSYTIPSGNINITTNGTNIDVAQYASASVNVQPTLQSKSATPTENQQTITPDNDYDGLSQVTVDAISSTYVGSGVTRVAATTYTPTTSNQTIASSSYLTGVQTISGDANLIPSNIRSGVTIFGVSGTHSGGGSSVNNQSKSVTPTESEQQITYDSGYTGLETVTVGAISSTYIGSGITQRTGTDLTASGATVTVPSGYYASVATKTIDNASITFGDDIQMGNPTIDNTDDKLTLVYNTDIYADSSSTSGYVDVSQKLGPAYIYANSNIPYYSDDTALTVSGATVTASTGYYSTAISKSVDTMTLPTSTSSTPTSGATNKATVSRSTSTQYINIPTGYNSSTAYYTISAVANGSVTAPSTISGTTATVSTGTNTLTLSKTVSVTPNVTTAGYISSGTAGNSTVSLTANVTTKAAATITPSTSNQTIASGTYLTGIQTISGDANLVSGNIRSGTSIFGVSGSYSGLDTSDATASASDIVSGETAYVNGSKVTGTLVINKYYTGSSAPASTLGENGDIYIQG